MARNGGSRARGPGSRGTGSPTIACSIAPTRGPAVVSTIADHRDGTADWRIGDLPAHIRDWITIDPVSGCWRYTRRTDRDGYGRLGSCGVHRAVWQQLVGEIPPGLVLDHVRARGCRWNDCCWPAHLEPVTHRVNVLRGTSFAARNYAKTHCDNGHEYDLYNTYWWRGRRDCRRCIADRARRYQRRKRQAGAVVTLPRAA